MEKKLRVVDMLDISEDVNKQFGKEGIIRLVNSMKKLEQVRIKGNRLANKPSSLKHISGLYGR